LFYGFVQASLKNREGKKRGDSSRPRQEVSATASAS
jgi:hypothetical protein